MKQGLPISAVIATRNRAQSLSRTLQSLLTQDVLPAEFIVVDSSEDDATRSFLSEFEKLVSPTASVRWVAADVAGAAAQRNQGVALATQHFICLFDDVSLFDSDCVARLWHA